MSPWRRVSRDQEHVLWNAKQLICAKCKTTHAFPAQVQTFKTKFEGRAVIVFLFVERSAGQPVGRSGGWAVHNSCFALVSVHSMWAAVASSNVPLGSVKTNVESELQSESLPTTSKSHLSNEIVSQQMCTQTCWTVFPICWTDNITLNWKTIFYHMGVSEDSPLNVSEVKIHMGDQ